MKVCGKKDIHVPGCDDCSELEERVEAVEECCDDAHDEIDTLNTDKADKDYVDDSIETVNQTIVDVADTLGERIDNIITASEPSVTTLWEGVMDSIGDSANLSEDVNDFDYLDIYYRTSVDESEGYYNTVRIPADQFANYTITVGGTLSPLGESPNLAQYLTQLSFVDDTATIDNIREWSWNGSQSSDASDDPQAETGVTIYRIDGVKETGGNAEIADAREGVDGTVYPSLGDAIRGQIQDTRDMIPELVKTVQGNPIVLDDAFGAVKNLTVELLPIQEGSGTPSPQNIRPITGHDSVTVTDTGKNLFDNTNPPTLITCYGSSGTAQTRKGYILNLPSGNYVGSVSWTGATGGTYIYGNVIDGNGGFVRFFYIVAGSMLYTPTITLADGERIVIFDAQADTQAYPDKFDRVNIQIEHGSTATDYAEYHGQSKTVTLPHTVYGAGVGVTSGEGKEKWSTFAIGDESATDFGTSALGIPYLDLYKPVRGGQDLPTICTEYEQIPVAGTGASGVFKNFASAYTIYDTRFTSASQAKALLESEGFLIVYTMETPTDLSTTPTDLTLYNGDNVISSDGDMELSYVQDMATVIRKIENQL